MSALDEGATDGDHLGGSIESAEFNGAGQKDHGQKDIVVKDNDVIDNEDDVSEQDDDDIWFEANDDLAAEGSPPPLTSEEVVAEEVEPTAPVVGGVSVATHDGGDSLNNDILLDNDGSRDNGGSHDDTFPAVHQDVASSPAASDASKLAAIAGVDSPTEGATESLVADDPLSTTFDLTPTIVDVRGMEVYLAESMVKELKAQQKMAAACKAEASYVKVCTSALSRQSLSEGGIGKEENHGMGIGLETDTVDSTRLDQEEQSGMGIRLDESIEASLSFEEKRINPSIHVEADSHGAKVYLAESLLREVLTQQRMAAACKAETRYIEMCTAAMMADNRHLPGASELEKSTPATVDPAEREGDQGDVDVCDGMEPGRSVETATDLVSTEHVQEVDLHERTREAEPYVLAQQDKLVFFPTITAPPTCDASINTEWPETCSQSTNTSPPEFCEQGVNTDPPPIAKETGCNTIMNCFDVLQRAKEMEELQFLKVEHRVAITEMNEAKSQKMVAEELVKIVQSDLAELRQHNLTETTRRLQLENELSDVKVDLSQTVAQLKEKEERVQELEESLTGTSLLVRKLEEQNAVSLMNRGGIDYMLQAKLAEGRAQEAEQKLEVLQSELLQAQSEVRRLLDRVAESSRDRSEMVSSKVHSQLMEIADEKAQAAERRNLELERELQDLRGKLSIYEAGGGAPSSFTHSTGLTGLTSFSSLSTIGSSYATSGLSSAYSPFSYTGATSKPLSFADQYNLHSDRLSSLSTPATALPVSTGLSFVPMSSSGSYGNGSDKLSSVGSREEVGVSGMLKPSQMFKKYGEKSHDSLGIDAPPPLSSDSYNKVDFELPSFETTPSKSYSMDIKKVVPGSHGNASNSDSSDWSSSSDGEGDHEPGEGEGVAMRPSHHTNLIAQWEWRTMADGADTSSTHQSSPLSKRRAPPPVAPKPHGMSKTATAGAERAVQLEASVSFDVPTHSATIQVLRKPRGPHGRSLPSRYHRQQLVT